MAGGLDAVHGLGDRAVRVNHERGPDHAVLEAYGAYGEKKLYGKTTVGV